MRSDPTHPYDLRRGACHVLSAIVFALCLAAIFSRVAPAAELATFNYDVGDRLSPFSVTDSAGQSTVLSPDTPTIVVFWSTWSESSKAAIADLVKGPPQGGTHWQIVPINVDGAGGSSLASISKVLRGAGYATGRIWRDPDLQLTYSWGIHTIPTVVMTGLGGFVVETNAGWNASFRDRIKTEYFAPAPQADSQPARSVAMAMTSKSRTVPELRRLYRQGQVASAIDSLTKVLRSDSSMAVADIARLLFWRREIADTIGLLSLTDSLAAARPRDCWLLVNRSLQRLDRQDWPGAKSDAVGALEADSSSAPAWITLAMASFETGDTALARETADSAWNRNRHSLGLLVQRARLADLSGQAKDEARFWQWAVEASLRQQRARPTRSMGVGP